VASVATEERPAEGADGHTYSGRGRVRFELAPEEYKEYRRLLDAESPPDPVADGGDRQTTDGSQALEAFVGQLDAHDEPSSRVEENQDARTADPFFDALRAEPARRVSANTGHDTHGSAALDGIAVSPRLRSVRARARTAVLGMTALLALCLAAYLILLPHSPSRSHALRSAEETGSSRVGDLRSFASSLSAVDRAAVDVVQVAGDHERAALAKAKAQRIAHRQAVERRTRQRQRAAARTHQQAITTSPTTSTTSQALAVPASSTTSSSTAAAPSASDSTTTSNGPSTTTHSHPFGDGGVLGAGHAG